MRTDIVCDLLQLANIRAVGLREEERGYVIVAENTTTPQSCSKCGHTDFYRHGTRTVTYADTPIHERPTRLELEVQRFRCKQCGAVTTAESPDLDDRRNATRRLIEYVQNRCFDTTFSWLANEIGVAVNTVKNIAQDYLEDSFTRQTPRILGMDEVHIVNQPRCVLVNLEMHTLFDMLASRKKDRLRDYFLSLQDRDQVEWVVMDMWQPYQQVVEETIPDAKIVIDRFHVVKEASEKLERLRKELQSQLPEAERRKLKKSTRWSLLRSETNRTEEDESALEQLRLQHPRLYEAWMLKEAFHKIYEEPTRASAERAFEAWANSIPTEFQAYYQPVVEMVNKRHQMIFNYFDCPASNGYTEAINGVIKVMNRMGRGYSFEMIRAKALFS
ncbi:ISL3 family transposase, partial [Candidatus Parcubacteria bacterium]